MTSLSPAHGPLVLIVDDDERNRRLARDVLRAAGIRTIEGATGAEAIELAERHLPDVVLLDLGLPDTDGASVARALGEGAGTEHIPVVAFTALPQAGDWHGDAGFAGYLEKPFDIGDFADRVRGFAASAHG